MERIHKYVWVGLLSCLLAGCIGTRRGEPMGQPEAIQRADAYLIEREVTRGRLVRIATTEDAYVLTYLVEVPSEQRLAEKVLKVDKWTGRVKQITWEPMGGD